MGVGMVTEQGSDDAFDAHDLHSKALRLFDEWCAADQDNRDEALDDLNFQALRQWDALDKAERHDQRRPAFTVDMCGPFIRQIDGELRQNPLSVKAFPAEGGDIEVAKVYGGMWRAIEESSNAERVFSLAGGQAAACGRGNWRLSLEYENDDSFMRCLRLRSIPNPLAVVRQPTAILPDNTDLNGCFVYDDMPRGDFKERFPSASETPWPGTDASFGNRVGWFASDTIRVCEYWYIKHVPSTLTLLSDGQILRDASPEDLLGVLMDAQSNGRFVQVTDRRQVKRRKVCMVLMSGAEILPKPDGSVAPYDFPGSIIPIFSVDGETINVDGKTVRRGVIRTIKDLQVIRNWAKSAEVETTAMAPRQKWLVTQKMIKGREHLWRTANMATTPYLIYDVDTAAPQMKPERLDPPEYNDAAARLADRTLDEARQGTGMFAANMGEANASDSGIKVKRLQQQGDTGNYLYIDNLILTATATVRAAVPTLPVIYDTTRQVRTLGEDMEPAIVRVNDGRLDLGRGSYDMRYRAGPSFVNARAEAAEGMREALQYAGPQYADIIIRRLAKAQDWPEADEIAAEMQQRAMQTGQIAGPTPAAGLLAGPGGQTPPQIAPGAPPPGNNGPPAVTPPTMPNGAGAPPNGVGALPMRANAAGVYEMDDEAMPPPRRGLRIVSVT